MATDVQLPESMLPEYYSIDPDDNLEHIPIPIRIDSVIDAVCHKFEEN